MLSPALGPRQFRFDHLSTVLPASDETRPWDASDRFQALSLDSLRHKALDVSDPVAAQGATREWHRRLTTPVTTLLLGLLAAPLFLTRSHFSRAGGSMLGIAVTIATFTRSQLGEGLTQAGVRIGARRVVAEHRARDAGRRLVLACAPRGGAAAQARRSALREETLRALPGRRPGKTRRHALARYVSARFLQLAALSFAALLTAYLMVDVMERLDWFARYSATGEEVARFYAARIPLLASRVIPMALLVGSALIASLLAAEGELIGMRACGIPAVRAMAPVLVISVAVTPLFFLLRNVVVPRTNALADQLKQTEIKADYYQQLSESQKTAVWHHLGSQVLEATRFDLEQGDAVDLTIYDLGSDGLPVIRSDARSARHIGGGIWRLLDPTRLELSAITRDPRSGRAPTRSSARSCRAEVDPMHCRSEICARDRDGHGRRLRRPKRCASIPGEAAPSPWPASCSVLGACCSRFTGPPFPAPAHTLW